MTTTASPNGLTSNRSTSDNASTAYLLAWYGEPPGSAISPPIELMFTTRPLR